MEDRLDRDTAIKEAVSSMSAGDELDEEQRRLELQALGTQYKLDADEKTDIIRMRRRWSNLLLGALLFLIGFDVVLIIFVGFGWWSFEGRALPLFVVDGLVKVIGLALIVVNFLFDKDSLK